MIRNKHLNKAKVKKNDEFYTRFEDIKNELQHYTEHFKDKVVYCNCDDYRISNFAKYFEAHFQRLELKKLIVSGLGVGSYMVIERSNVDNSPQKKIIYYSDGDMKKCKQLELFDFEFK